MAGLPPGSMPQFGRPAFPGGAPGVGVSAGAHPGAPGMAPRGAMPFPAAGMGGPGGMPASMARGPATGAAPVGGAAAFPTAGPAQSAPTGMPGQFPARGPGSTLPGAGPMPTMPGTAPRGMPTTAAPAFPAGGMPPRGGPAPGMPGPASAGYPGAPGPAGAPRAGGPSFPPTSASGAPPATNGTAGFPAQAFPGSGPAPRGLPATAPTSGIPGGMPGPAPSSMPRGLPMTAPTAGGTLPPRGGMPGSMPGAGPGPATSGTLPPRTGFPAAVAARPAAPGFPGATTAPPMPGSAPGLAAVAGPPTSARPPFPTGGPSTTSHMAGPPTGAAPSGALAGVPSFPAAAPGGQVPPAGGPFARGPSAPGPAGPHAGAFPGAPTRGPAGGAPPTVAGGPPRPGMPMQSGPPTGPSAGTHGAAPPTGPPAGAFPFAAGAGAAAFHAGTTGLPAAFAAAPEPPTMGSAAGFPGAPGMPHGPRGMPGPGSMPPGGMPGMPGGAPSPAAAAPMAEVNDKYQCLPAYMSLTMGAIPQSKQLAEKSCLPFGLCVQPLAESEDALPGGVPVIDMGALGVIRCKKCRAYINPFVKFVDGGRRWRCNLCNFVNDVPAAYFQPLDAEGNRVDVSVRPELHMGSVEFVAPSEYMVRPPQPPVYVFVIDVSYASVSTGVLHAAVTTIKQCLDRLPGEGRTQVGFVTYDTSVQFYNLREGLKAPQMLVVPDVHELFMPVPEELLVNLSESRHLVHALLDALPGMFMHNKGVESALGPALDAAFNIMQHIGGKMVVMQATLPSVGVGRLKPRELPKMLGSDKEHTLLAPDAGDDGAFYKAKAVDFSRQQISVDTFLFAHNYTDVATIGALSRYTAGQVYYYPSFTAATDGERFSRDLARDLTRTTGFEAVMRIRTTRGLAITNFYGNFFIRGTDLLALPNATCDTAFNVEFAHEELLQPGSVIAIQAALLYTSSSGQRRINVHTMCKPVTTVLADLFRGVSVDAVANMMAKIALDNALRVGLPQARRYLHRALVDIVRGYRNASATPYGAGGVMPPGGHSRALPSMATSMGPQPVPDSNAPPLPESLQLLPLYSLGLQKCTLYRGGEQIRSDERAALVYRMLTMPVSNSRGYVHPRFFALHELSEGAGRPNPAGNAGAVVMPTMLNLTAASLSSSGVYILDDTVECYMWIGRGAPAGLIHALFGHALDGVDLNLVNLPPASNDFAARVHAILGALRSDAPQQARVRLVREGSNDIWEARFHWHMFEDRQNFPGGTIAYSEYMPIVLREAQMSQVGGTM